MTIKRSDKVEVRSLAAYYSQLDDLLNKQQVHVEPSIISARLSSDNNTILYANKNQHSSLIEEIPFGTKLQIGRMSESQGLQLVRVRTSHNIGYIMGTTKVEVLPNNDKGIVPLLVVPIVSVLAIIAFIQFKSLMLLKYVIAALYCGLLFWNLGSYVRRYRLEILSKGIFFDRVRKFAIGSAVIFAVIFLLVDLFEKTQRFHDELLRDIVKPYLAKSISQEEATHRMDVQLMKWNSPVYLDIGKPSRLADNLMADSIGGTEFLLLYLLQKYDDRSIATVLLNSGNSILKDAARQWAYEHGYAIEQMATNEKPKKWR